MKLQKQTFVSVVIPCYNHGQYLETAIQSALGQGWPELEIVIVDDGSTDKYTLEVLDVVRKRRIRVLSQENSGPGKARNAGVETARGDLVLLVDADDCFDDTFLEKAVPVLENQPSVGAVSCYVQKFGLSAACKHYAGGSAASFVGYQCNAHSFALIRKSSWLAVGGYSEDPDLGSEDWDFWLRFTGAGWDVHILREVLCYYRTKSGSRSKVYSQKPRNMRQLVERNRSVFQRHVVEAIVEREEIIEEQKTTIRGLRSQIRTSWCTRLAKAYRFLKNLFRTR